mgnify:CR=1 FL=1
MTKQFTIRELGELVGYTTHEHRARTPFLNWYRTFYSAVSCMELNLLNDNSIVDQDMAVAVLALFGKTNNDDDDTADEPANAEAASALDDLMGDPNATLDKFMSEVFGLFRPPF